MKNFKRCRTKFGMARMLAGLAFAVAIVIGFASCETETETEYVTKEVEKTYASAVTFTVAETDTEGVLSLTMQTATEGAEIYYTADGAAPTAQSTKYESALTVSADTVFKAIAVKEGIENSPVSTASVSIKEKKVTVEVEKIVEVDKKADETAPAAVTNLAATAKDRRVLLTWTDATDSDIYGYEVSYSGSGATSRVVLPALDTTSMMVPQGAGGTYVSALTNGREYTFTVKTVDTSGNKSEGVSATATPVALDASEAMQIALSAAVPQENGYTGSKSNTKVTVTASITTASTVKKVVWKKNGSLIAKTLLADTAATAATISDDNAKWTFDITATDESANGTYTIAAIDEAGREEAEQITIDNFDFTPPAKVKITYGNYDSNEAEILLTWTESSDSDYDHVDISFTSNDGTSDSTASEAVSVKKGTTNKTFGDIDGSKKYYTYTFVTYDELGNEGSAYTYKVSVSTTVSNVPEDFVEVAGTEITGNESWTPSSSVFVSGRSLTIDDLYVCDHEVTQKEYETYCKYGSSRPSDTYGKGDDYPAYYVNWYDAVVYCNLRSMDEGLTPAYAIGGETDPSKWTGIVSTTSDGVTKYCGPSSSNATWNALTYDTTANGYRLPTEAEWEYIAREAASSSTTYSGSNTIDDVAWYTSNSDSKTHEVNTKAANSLGIYDMSGNVWEWCYDWYGTISSSTGASGSASGSNRVERGGSWYNDADLCTVSYRDYDSPDYRINYGFRVVRNAE